MYYQAGVEAEDFQKELTHQLRKLPLGISVGLVKEPPKEQYHFDPYAHFGPDHDVKRRDEDDKGEADDIIHKYKICEVRPPSIEKVNKGRDILIMGPQSPYLTRRL